MSNVPECDDEPNHLMNSEQSRQTFNERERQDIGTYKTVQIVRPNDGGSFEIDSNELERVFGRVADVPVAVYSLAGAFRKGKSFMLNLFLRYLWSHKQGQPKSWLANKEEQLREGFGWRGGKERHTQGVWLWNEPFFVKTPAGEVAVFLMDTQGSFDSSTTVKGCSVIFALSTMISSVQIYNVMQQIQEDALQHLQLFTDYGKAAHTSSRLNGKPFQNLLFLVRDWQDPDCELGIPGGRQVLKDLLAVRTKHKDLESVRKNVNDSYDDVSCFLMPYPGRKVAVRGERQGSSIRLADVDSGFLDQLQELVQHLFLPHNVVIKRVNGNIVTGQALINFMLAYFEVFRSGEMPDVGTILQASAKAAMIPILQQCKEAYSQQMTQLFNEFGFVEVKVLQEQHVRGQAVALQKFDVLPKLGHDSFIAEYRKRLIEIIKQEFATHEQTNIAQMERLKNRVRDVVAQAEEKYSSSLESASGGKVLNDEGLRCADDQSCKAALDLYEQNTKDCPREFVEQYKSKLIELMRQEFKRFQMGNHQQREELRRGLESETLKSIDAYVKEMEQKCSDVYLEDGEFDKAHDSWQRSALIMFDSSVLGIGTSQRKEEKERLRRKISEEKRKLKQTNNINKKLAESKTIEIMNEAKALYTSLMNEAYGSDYTELPLLEDAHAESKQQSRAIIASVEQDRGEEFAQQCRSQLDEFLDNEFGKIKRRNDARGERARNDFEKAKSDALLHYQRRIGEGAKIYQEETNLHKRHSELKTEAIQDYNRVDKKRPKTYFDEFSEKLNADIEKHFTFFKGRNEQNKVKCKAIAEQKLQEIKEDYMKTMDNLCSGSYVEENVLQEFHDKLKGNGKRQIETASESRVLLEPFLRRCESELNELYLSAKERNEENRTLWFRITSTVDQYVAQPIGKYIVKPIKSGIKTAFTAVKGLFN